MTPEELKKLCDAATAGGPSSVDTCKRTEARAELRFLGFKSESVGIARARSYAAIWAAGTEVVEAYCVVDDVFQLKAVIGELSDALATGGTE